MAIIILSAAAVVLLTPGAILPPEPDLTIMHPRPNPALDAEETLATRFGISPQTIMVYLRADDETSLLRLAHEVEARLASQRVRATGITGTFGLATLLPDPANRPNRIAATGPALADQVVKDFHAVIAQSIFDPAAYEPYAKLLHQLLTPTAVPGIADLRRYPNLSETILSASTDRNEAITLVFLDQTTENRAARDATIAAVREAMRDIGGATVTGMGVLNHDTELTVRRGLPRLVLAAIIVVAIYLAAHFRSVVDCVLAVLPTIFSLACLLAFMRLTGQKLNMVNLVAFPLLIGIDVDYGIFIVSAVRREEVRELDQSAIAQRLAPAAAAIVLCAAATLLGFGSLAFTSIPAVRTLGIAVAVGIAGCVAGVFLLVVPIILSRKRA
jgi:predicted RND superfamily exporter protein